MREERVGKDLSKRRLGQKFAGSPALATSTSQEAQLKYEKRRKDKLRTSRFEGALEVLPPVLESVGSLARPWDGNGQARRPLWGLLGRLDAMFEASGAVLERREAEKAETRDGCCTTYFGGALGGPTRRLNM